jgi:hypothetical protein
MAKTTAKTKPEGKFSSMIKRNGDSIIGDRADRIIKSAKVAQRAIVDKLDQELMNLDDKRDLMLDQSPDNRYSLTLGKSFESDKWAAEYQSISIQIANKKIELAIAQANYQDLFGAVAE